MDAIDVHFYVEGDEHCVAVEDSTSGTCQATCEQAIQLAAVRVGEVMDRTCPDSLDQLGQPVQQELPTTEWSEPTDPGPDAMRLITPPLVAPTSSIRTNVTFATLASTGHPDYAVAAGFMSGVGLSESGTQFALIGGMADVTPKNWYWRMGLEICRGRGAGRWEWSGCFALGGGEIYNGQAIHHGYPWMALSPSIRFHVNDRLVLRLDLGAQVSVAQEMPDVDALFVLPERSPVTVIPMVTAGVQYTIPEM